MTGERALRVNVLGQRKGFGMDRSMALLGSAFAAAGCRLYYNGLSASVTNRWLNNDRRPIRKARLFVARAIGSVRGHPFDVCVHMERIEAEWLGVAPVHCVVPNPEHFGPDSLARLSDVDYVLCKTRYTEEVFNRHGANTYYTGFTSQDLFRPEVEKDYGSFFHLAGKSPAKGTEALVEVWSRHPEWPQLTIVQDPRRAQPLDVPNIKHVVRYVASDELVTLQNRFGVHLCPSRVEGFGHYVNEAMGCGAVVLTTDGPPMNELVGEGRGVLVRYGHSEPHLEGTKFYVDLADLEEKVETLLGTAESEKERMGERARRWFLNNDAEFLNRVHVFVHKVLASRTHGRVHASR